MKRFWKGYDSFEQTKDAQTFLKAQTEVDSPFFLMLSWGTPHAPYHTAPAEYRAQYDSASVLLRPNVPKHLQGRARRDLAGYYAHCTALDDMLADIQQTLEETGLAKNTLVLFTSDHGDLLGSQGFYKKQQPYEESIRVPMLIDGPKVEAGSYHALMNSEDIMPTLLGLAGVSIPSQVEGISYAPMLRGEEQDIDTTTLISCVQPFGQWNPIDHGGKEYRGLRSLRYTYTRELTGPWQLFDNVKDPFQLNNLVGKGAYTQVQEALDQTLTQKLKAHGDEFLPGLTYVERYKYPALNEKQTVPYRN